jgi:hypothetical protein
MIASTTRSGAVILAPPRCFLAFASRAERRGEVKVTESISIDPTGRIQAKSLGDSKQHSNYVYPLLPLDATIKMTILSYNIYHSCYAADRIHVAGKRPDRRVGVQRGRLPCNSSRRLA